MRDQVRVLDDNEPFDERTVGLHIGLSRDGVADSKARAEALRVMRARVERWAVARGFAIVDSDLLRVTEGVEVTVALSETMAEMCTVRSLALRPERMNLRAEPKTWSDRILDRLSGGFETADPTFDERWEVETDNEPVARRLLDARVRLALSNHPIWCRLVYTDGRIETVLDSGRNALTGTHLLAAVEVAVAMARAAPHPSPSPYR
jgi:hypothetical protein